MPVTRGEDRCHTHPAAQWAQTAKLLASDADALDELGYVVAIDGDHIAVATPWDDEVTGDAGAAYVFERDREGRWFEAAKLTAPDAEGCCWYLGTSVGISGDTLVAGAPGADPIDFDETGAAYVFERDESGAWRLARKLKAPDVQGELWASSVAIDGDLIVVGAKRDDDAGGDAGAVYVFERDAGGPGRWGYGGPGQWGEGGDLVAIRASCRSIPQMWDKRQRESARQRLARHAARVRRWR